jgi:hypothetical protein
LLSRHLSVFALTGLAALALTRDPVLPQNPATVPPATAVDFTRAIGARYATAYLVGEKSVGITFMQAAS